MTRDDRDHLLYYIVGENRRRARLPSGEDCDTLPREEPASDLSSEVTSTPVDLDIAGGNLCGCPRAQA